MWLVLRRLKAKDLKKYREDFLHPQLLDYLFHYGVEFFVLNNPDEKPKGLSQPLEWDHEDGAMTQYHGEKSEKIEIIFRYQDFTSMDLIHECAHAYDAIIAKPSVAFWSQDMDNIKWINLCDELTKNKLPEDDFCEIFAAIFTNVEHADIAGGSYILNTTPIFKYVSAIIKRKILPIVKKAGFTADK